MRSLSASNSGSLTGVPRADAPQATGIAIDLPDRAELPAERLADRLQNGGVHLDRGVLFREDPGDRVLHALEVTRVGELSVRPMDVDHRYH
jgi:hypothetical protein